MRVTCGQNVRCRRSANSPPPLKSRLLPTLRLCNHLSKTPGHWSIENLGVVPCIKLGQSSRQCREARRTRVAGQRDWRT
jgi:hypothetical protein